MDNQNNKNGKNRTLLYALLAALALALVFVIILASKNNLIKNNTPTAMKMPMMSIFLCDRLLLFVLMTFSLFTKVIVFLDFGVLRHEFF